MTNHPVSTEIDYLDVENVIAIHEWAIEKYGGLQGVHFEKLEAKLALPMAGFGSYENYPTLEEKAAIYLYHLASGHCFADGNKRTSYLTAFTFLDINGYDLVVDDEEVFRFVISVADDKKRPPFEDVVSWIKKHMHKQP